MMLTHKGTQTIRTERLILRRFRMEDAQAMFDNWASDDQVTKYLTWLAEYKEAPTYTGDYQFWQYTSNGWVDGITGRVDLNIGNLSLANLQEELVKEEAVTPTPVPESEEDAEPTVTPEVESTEEVEPTVTPDAGEQ